MINETLNYELDELVLIYSTNVKKYDLRNKTYPNNVFNELALIPKFLYNENKDKFNSLFFHYSSKGMDKRDAEIKIIISPKVEQMKVYLSCDVKNSWLSHELSKIVKDFNNEQFTLEFIEQYKIKLSITREDKLKFSILMKEFLKDNSINQDRLIDFLKNNL